MKHIPLVVAHELNFVSIYLVNRIKKFIKSIFPKSKLLHPGNQILPSAEV